MKHSRTWGLAGLTLAGALGFAGAASAVEVQWADLTSSTQVGDSWTVSGSIAVDGQNVGVTFAGDGLSFVQLNGSGTNYWTQASPAPYTGGAVSDAPPNPDIIALNQGGLKSITFSQPVSDVYLGLVSWNGNSGTFDQPLKTISSGCGYWGCGSFANVTPTSFTGDGELHGVIEFTGNFSKVSFTDLSENWHGIQIGIAGVAPPPVSAVPEPQTWTLAILGLGLAGGALRYRRRSEGAAAALSA